MPASTLRSLQRRYRRRENDYFYAVLGNPDTLKIIYNYIYSRQYYFDTIFVLVSLTFFNKRPRFGGVGTLQ